MKTKYTFNGNYIEYENKEDKGKNLSLKKYFNMIKPYLRDMINDHKAHEKLKVHSGNFGKQQLWENGKFN